MYLNIVRALDWVDIVFLMSISLLHGWQKLLNHANELGNQKLTRSCLRGSA